MALYSYEIHDRDYESPHLPFIIHKSIFVLIFLNFSLSYSLQVFIKEQSFRSLLELILLMDSAVSQT